MVVYVDVYNNIVYMLYVPLFGKYAILFLYQARNHDVSSCRISYLKIAYFIYNL